MTVTVMIAVVVGMKDPDVVCGGGAKPGDTYLLSTVHCIDDGSSSETA